METGAKELRQRDRDQLCAQAKVRPYGPTTKNRRDGAADLVD
jgi:hypothetical protein